MSVTPSGEPQGDPPNLYVSMHGESHDSSILIQIGTQVIQEMPPPALEVRSSLPPDTMAFTGREKELGVIIGGAANAVGEGGVVAIHAIDGMPGIGKTALAVHVAHLLRQQFSDRQLFIDLHAHTPGHVPAVPEAALAQLLAAVGVDARHIPDDLEGRVALWRDRMASEQALLVLDNAANSGQVLPLLPGGPSCLVLITSRRHLGDLPNAVVPVLLGTLSPENSLEMLKRLAPRAIGDPAASELVRLAGYLPLAISLLARVYSKHQTWTIADLLRETRASLLSLAAEKDSVAAAFDVSYRYLDPRQQHFFRCLGLHKGTSIDAYAAAALAGVTVLEAYEHLDALHSEGMMIEVAYRRYGMHDLIRRYAKDLSAADPVADREHGLERLLDYFQYTATISEERLARQAQTRDISVGVAVPPTESPNLSDNTHALQWARDERVNLLACLDYATRYGQHARVVGLTGAIAALLRQDGPWADAVSRHGIAELAARNLGDRQGQVNALNHLGVVRRLSGDYPGAKEALDEALRISREIADRFGQANSLSNLGVVRQQAGNYSGAENALAAALDISREVGDRLGQAYALNCLGVVGLLTGNYPGSEEALDAALGTSREIGDQAGEAGALGNLGILRRQTGDYAGAEEALEQALSISNKIGDRLGVANSYGNLGMVRSRTGEYLGADKALVGALNVYREIGDLPGQASAFNSLGIVRRLTRNYLGAAQALQSALDISRGLGDQGIEVEVLNELGALQRDCGDLSQARIWHGQALELARGIDSEWDEAHALAGLARCAIIAGRTKDAETGLREAWEIFKQIGAAEVTGVAAELAALTGAEPDH